MGYGRQPQAMKLPFGSAERVIYGGGYANRPEHMYGIKMAVEIKAPCDVDIPTVDFSIPPEEAMRKGIRNALWKIAAGRQEVFTGCMGGIGRTGLFLGVLVRVLGEKDPVTYVRKNYYGHAIETQEQQDFVNNIELGNLIYMAKAAKLYARLRDFI